MKGLKLIDIAPYSGKRIQPFEGERKYLSTGDLKIEGISFDIVTYKNKPSRADIIVSKGDVLFAKMANTNKVLLIDELLDGIIVSTGFSVHKPNKDILNENYLVHYLKNNIFLRQKNKYCTGTTQSAITNSGIEKIIVPVHSLPNQIQIAQKLDKVETLIKQSNKSLELLEEYLRSTFIEMFGDPISNEKKFVIKYLSEYYINPKEGTKCGPFGSALKKGECTPSGIPVWTMDNISKTGEFNENDSLYISEKKYKELDNYHVMNGDIIISRAGTVGKMCIVKSKAKKSIISSNLIRLRLGKELLPIYFLFLMKYFQTRIIKLKHGNEDAYTHMSTRVLDKIKFPYPPLKIQKDFEKVVETIESLKIQYMNRILELEKLYRSISQQVFKL